MVSEYLPDETFAFLKGDTDVSFIRYHRSGSRVEWLKVLLLELFFGYKNRRMAQEAEKKLQQQSYDVLKVMDIECIAFTTAKGSDKVLESSPISLRLAIQEGWYTKNGSKWRTMPKQMLMYRAASFWTNAYAPELSMGMKTEDEIRDIVDVDYEEITATQPEDGAEKKTVSLDDEKPQETTVKEDKSEQSAEQGGSASSKAKNKDLFGGQRTPGF